MLREVRLKKDDHSISPLAASALVPADSAFAPAGSACTRAHLTLVRADSITNTSPELTGISTDDGSSETIIGININTISVAPPKPKEVQM